MPGALVDSGDHVLVRLPVRNGPQLAESTVSPAASTAPEPEGGCGPTLADWSARSSEALKQRGYDKMDGLPLWAATHAGCAQRMQRCTSQSLDFFNASAGKTLATMTDQNSDAAVATREMMITIIAGHTAHWVTCPPASTHDEVRKRVAKRQNQSNSCYEKDRKSTRLNSSH